MAETTFVTRFTSQSTHRIRLLGDCPCASPRTVCVPHPDFVEANVCQPMPAISCFVDLNQLADSTTSFLHRPNSLRCSLVRHMKLSKSCTIFIPLILLPWKFSTFFLKLFLFDEDLPPTRGISVFPSRRLSAKSIWLSCLPALGTFIFSVCKSKVSSLFWVSLERFCQEMLFSLETCPCSWTAFVFSPLLFQDISPRGLLFLIWFNSEDKQRVSLASDQEWWKQVPKHVS